jgi:hypothetical protein
MNLNTFEDMVYEYGYLQYKIGRMETDDKASMKEYSKLVDQKDKLKVLIANFLKELKLKK